MEKVDRVSISETGLQFSEFAILEVLLHKNAMSMRAIGAKVLLTSGSMTAAVNRLEKKDLVRRIPDSSDRRRIQVHLTELGLNLIRHAYSQHEKELQQLAEVLTEEERHLLVQLLKKIGYQAEKMSS